jgi:hypothetical protein
VCNEDVSDKFTGTDPREIKVTLKYRDKPEGKFILEVE